MEYVRRFKFRIFALILSLCLSLFPLSHLPAQESKLKAKQAQIPQQILSKQQTPLKNNSSPAEMIADSDGNIYGITSAGGDRISGSGYGVIYELGADGSYAILHHFTGGTDGGNSTTAVTLDSAGNLYGTTRQLPFPKGQHGVLYKLEPSGRFTVLHAFSGGEDSSDPDAPVVCDRVGNLYGVTLHGGAADGGVLYKLDNLGHFSILHQFKGEADGGPPITELVRDDAGNLYGAAALRPNSAPDSYSPSILYKLDRHNRFRILYTFDAKADKVSAYPGQIICDGVGNLYGAAACGHSCAGVIYRLDTNRNARILHTFIDGAEERPLPLTNQ